MHANFSNSLLRECGSQETYEKVCEAFRPVASEHIAVYGEFNDQRLTDYTKQHQYMTSAMVFQTGEPLLEYQLSLLKKDGKDGLKIEDLHQMEIHIRLLEEL